MCGVRIRFGQPASGDPAGSGSCSNTSSAAPPRRPLRERRRDRRLVDDAAARRVDQDRAGASSARAARRRSGAACSRRAARAARRRRPRPAARRAARRARRSAAQTADVGAICASKPIDAHAERAREARREAADAAEADQAERLAGELAAVATARRAATRRAPPSAVDAYAPRSSSIAVPITYSATASALAPVAGITSMPRARGRRRRRCCRDRRRAGRRPCNRGAAPSRSRSTCVRLRTISASALGELLPERRRPIDERRVVARVEAARARRATAASSMNSLMTMRIALRRRMSRPNRHELCMPQRRTVRISIVRKITFSTTSPIRITVKGRRTPSESRAGSCSRR